MSQSQSQDKKKRSVLTGNWCFTGWPHKGAKGVSWFWDHYGMDGGTADISYICGKMEKSKSGLPHIQGWVQFSSRKRAPGVRKVFPGAQFHTAACKGTEEENEKYCKKTSTQIGDFEFFGSFTTQGSAKRTIDALEAAVKAGATKRQLWEDHFGIMTTRHRGVYEGMARLQDNPDVKPDFSLAEFGWNPMKFGQQKEEGDEAMTWVLAGPAGIGKTEFALAHFESPLMIKNLNELDFFDKNRHDGIIFDDFDSEITKLKRTEQVHLCEQRRDSGVRILYKVVTIPGKTRKVFTTNEVDGKIFHPHPSVGRRHRIRVLEKVEHPKKPVAEVDPADVESYDSSFEAFPVGSQVPRDDESWDGNLDGSQDGSPPAWVDDDHKHDSGEDSDATVLPDVPAEVGWTAGSSDRNALEAMAEEESEDDALSLIAGGQSSDDEPAHDLDLTDDVPGVLVRANAYVFDVPPAGGAFCIPSDEDSD